MESLVWFIYSGMIYSAIKAELDLGELELRALFCVYYSHVPVTVNYIVNQTNNTKNIQERRNVMRDVLSDLINRGLLTTIEGKTSAVIYVVTPKGKETIGEIGRVCHGIIPSIHQTF